VSDHPRSTEAYELSDDDATRYLHVALDRPHRPIDDLIERLNRPDGESWMAEVVGTVEPSARTLDELTATKNEAKRALASAAGELRLAAILRYFIAVGTALADHDALITGRTRQEVDDALSDLASATPRGWTELLLRATARK